MKFSPVIAGIPKPPSEKKKKNAVAKSFPEAYKLNSGIALKL